MVKNVEIVIVYLFLINEDVPQNLMLCDVRNCNSCGDPYGEGGKVFLNAGQSKLMAFVLASLHLPCDDNSMVLLVCLPLLAK